MPRRIGFALLLVAQAWGEPVHMLEWVLPRGAARGTTVEVNLHGQYLNDPREVFFYAPGIKASGITPGAKPAEDVKVRFEIAPDCPLGEHVLRLRTATGLSDAMTFWVGPFPQVFEAEKRLGENDTMATAQAIAMNTTVEGQIHPGNQPDKDIYSVAVTKGERISVELESVRLGTLHYSNGENDLAIRILDASGRELAQADESALYVQDPVLSVIAPRTERYFIEVTQKLYQVPREAWYRVHIGNFSRPTGIFPAGGQTGQKLSVRVLGDPAGERTESVTLPSATGNFDYYSGPRGQRPPSPNVLRVSPYPNVLKAEGDGPTAVPSLPAALNGIFTDKTHAHTFTFAVKKGESWRVRVYARTLGSPMDPRIWIRAANSSKNLASVDDSKMTDLGYVSGRNSWSVKDILDPVAVLKATVDGQYTLGIEDTRGLAGPDYVYRVEIEPLRDAIYTHITAPDGYQMPKLAGLIIPQGGRWTLNVQTAQGLGNNYKDAIELEAIGLPRGLKMIAPLFGKGVNREPVQFIADPDAEQQTALIELLARPVNRATPLETASRQAFYLFNRPNEYPWHVVFLDKYALAVTEPAPFDLELEQPAVSLARNGELTLKVKLNRHRDFKGAVEIQSDWLPPRVNGSQAQTILPDATQAEFRIQANDRATPGVYQITMNATTNAGDNFSGYGRVRVSSKFVNLEIADPPVTIELQRSAVERGRRGEIVGVVNHAESFEGKATVNLIRLPKGITMVGPAPEITAADDRVVFPVEASTDALLGLYRDVACELKLSSKGQALRFNTGSGVLRVDPSRTVSARAPTVVSGIPSDQPIPAAKRKMIYGPPAPVSFRLDVMPVFFRAGCNSGGCHGAAIGKDGFHLSLFGYDPAGDYFRLTQQMVGRRVDLAAPQQSLLLLKSIGAVPHAGGRRFRVDSEYYDTLLRWIQYGASDDSGNVPQVTGISLVPDKVVFSGKETKKPLQPLQVIANYSDGTRRLVNHLALYLTNNKTVADINDQGMVAGGTKGDTFVFARFAKFTTGAEIIVLPGDKTFVWPKVATNNYIDDLIDVKLKYLRILPSQSATDEQFLRRVYLDLIGLPPTPAEYRAFMASGDRDRRAKLIDALLERDEFADVWTAKWAETLKVVSGVNSSFGTDRKAAYSYYEWIRQQMRQNTPLDQFVKSQIAATGSNLADPPVNLYTMIPQGQYDAKAVAQDVAQVFTGVRIQCAQCHNHPFDRWTQDDFYGFVSFFTGVRRKTASESREIYIDDDVNAAPAKHLLDGHPVPAKFLGGTEPDVTGKDPRPALADWLTSKDNPFFAKNLANRIWAHFFGRGIIEPVDDVRISNPPSNLELIDELARRLADYRFDFKRLISDICNSQTYQLVSAPNASNRDDDTQFSHARLRRLRADVLLDSLSAVTGATTAFNNYPTGFRAMELFEGGSRANNYFLKIFGMTNRDTVHASETRFEPTLAQALHLINGDTLDNKIARSTVVANLMKDNAEPDAILKELYIRVLSRQPSQSERARLLPMLTAKPGDRQAYDDVFWALVNSSEFEVNH